MKFYFYNKFRPCRPLYLYNLYNNLISLRTKHFATRYIAEQPHISTPHSHSHSLLIDTYLISFSIISLLYTRLDRAVHIFSTFLEDFRSPNQVLCSRPTYLSQPWIRIITPVFPQQSTSTQTLTLLISSTVPNQCWHPCPISMKP